MTAVGRELPAGRYRPADPHVSADQAGVTARRPRPVVPAMASAVILDAGPVSALPRLGGQAGK